MTLTNRSLEEEIFLGKFKSVSNHNFVDDLSDAIDLETKGYLWLKLVENTLNMRSFAQRRILPKMADLPFAPQQLLARVLQLP